MNLKTNIEMETMEPKTNTGENIKKLRDILGISQNQLAMTAGISANTLRKVEGQKTVDDKMLDKIAYGMGVPGDLIRNYKHENTVNYIISNNTFENKGSSSIGNSNDNRIIDPLEKVSELYERLMEEREKNMRREIEELKKLE